MGETGRVAVILQSYRRDPRHLLAILLDIQEREKYLSPGAMRSVAEYLGIPESRVFAVATFYSSLSLEKKGATLIRVCNGTACHLKGAASVLRGLAETLGLENIGTTSDGEYTLEIVNCVGACAMAPVVMVDGQAYGKIDPNDPASALRMGKTQ